VREEIIAFLVTRTATKITVLIISSSTHNKDCDYDCNPHKKDYNHRTVIMATVFIIRTATMIAILIMSSSSHNKD